MLVKTLAHGKLVLARFLKYPDVSTDTETVAAEKYPDKKSTLIIGRARIKVWSMCHRGEAYSFPTNLIGPYPTMEEWCKVFSPLFLSKKILHVFHNFNYDGNQFLTYGQRVRRIWDTVIGCHYANPNLDKDLK